MSDNLFYQLIAAGMVAWQLYLIAWLLLELKRSRRLENERRTKWAADEERLAEMERKVGIKPLFRPPAPTHR